MSSTTPSSSTTQGIQTIRSQILRALDTTALDSSEVKGAVLQEYRRQHPAVSLDDILELNTMISVPEANAIGEQAESVLSQAIKHHTKWMGQPSTQEVSDARNASIAEGR